ncbi:CNX1 [Symbiodinium natans]|uniref:CNX1 protein n=1 Tax=Symbiodinium natans TaxID=878477 RepID=A0A812JDG1_9DINO|nr:CNX1 [Symbiodinium natans]
MGYVSDDPSKLRATLASAFQQADVVITSGGVSRGSKDYIKELLSEIGEIHFGEMCMKPGKPSTFATVAGPEAQSKLFFGLPGNPVSCFVTFKLLAAPALERLRGLPQADPIYPRVDAELAGSVEMDPVRPEYHRARARWESGRIVAESTGFQRSSRIASIAEANCLLEIPKNKGTLPKGTVVKALLLPHGSRSLAPSPEGFPGVPRP